MHGVTLGVALFFTIRVKVRNTFLHIIRITTPRWLQKNWAPVRSEDKVLYSADIQCTNQPSSRFTGFFFAATQWRRGRRGRGGATVAAWGRVLIRIFVIYIIVTPSRDATRVGFGLYGGGSVHAGTYPRLSLCILFWGGAPSALALTPLRPPPNHTSVAGRGRVPAPHCFCYNELGRGGAAAAPPRV